MTLIQMEWKRYTLKLITCHSDKQLLLTRALCTKIFRDRHIILVSFRDNSKSTYIEYQRTWESWDENLK